MTIETQAPRGASRRTVVTGAAWSVPVIAAAMAAPAASASDPTQARYITQANGRLISGSVLGLNLDSIVAVNGVTAKNLGNEGAATPTPASAPAAGGIDAFKNPLDISALNGALELQLAGLSNLLQLPLATEVGVLGQYAQALYSGQSTGASGVVNDSGAIALSGAPAAAPALATFDLKKLVEQISPGLSSALAAVANLSLVAGAVGGSSKVDADVDPTAVARAYVAAYLRLKLESPVIGAVATTADTALNTVGTVVNGLTAQVLPALTSGIGSLLGGVLGALGLGDITLNLGATVDLAPVRSLLTTPFTDTAGILNINLGAGTVTIDVAGLLANAYPGSYTNGLNGLAPNTELLLNGPVIIALQAALTKALEDWLANVVTVLRAQIAAIAIDATIGIKLEGNILGNVIHVATLTVKVKGSLAELLAGTAVATVSTQLLGTGLVGSLITALVNPLLSGLVGALTQGVVPLLGGIINGILDTAVTQFSNTVTAVIAPVVTLVAGILTALNANNILKLVVNAQNTPPLSLTGTTQTGDALGRHEVAALWISVLPVVATGVNLYLGRAWAGQNTVI